MSSGSQASAALCCVLGIAVRYKAGKEEMGGGGSSLCPDNVRGSWWALEDAGALGDNAIIHLLQIKSSHPTASSQVYSGNSQQYLFR